MSNHNAQRSHAVLVSRCDALEGEVQRQRARIAELEKEVERLRAEGQVEQERLNADAPITPAEAQRASWEILRLAERERAEEAAKTVTVLVDTAAELGRDLEAAQQRVADLEAEVAATHRESPAFVPTNAAEALEWIKADRGYGAWSSADAHRFTEACEMVEVEVEQLRSLAGRLAVAYHMQNHASFVGKRLYEQCQKPFCVEARALHLPVDAAVEAAGGES